LKKRSKKLLIIVGVGTTVANAPKDQKFFGSFFQKRSALFGSQKTGLRDFSRSPFCSAQRFETS
jgi:hypothetical protein